MKLVVDKASLVSVADAIRTKGNTTDDLEFPNGFVDAVNGIESGGGGTEEIEQIIDQSEVLDSTDGTVTEKVEQLIDKAEDENVWCAYTEKLTSAAAIFQSMHLTKMPRTNFINASSLSYAFANNDFESIDYYINSKNCTNFSSAFAGCSKLKRIKGINTSKATTVREMFGYLRSDEFTTIEEPLDLSSVSSAHNIVMFAGTGGGGLKDIKFVANCIHWSIAIMSPALSAESISGEKGIINGLNSEVTGQTLTLRLAAVKKAFETSEGANDGDTSETWNALVASKPNWTITLS